MSETDQMVTEGGSLTIPPLETPSVSEAPVSDTSYMSGGGKPGKIRPFRKRSVEWLKKEAKLRGMSGYSKKKKGELVDMLKGSKPPAKAFQGSEQLA